MRSSMPTLMRAATCVAVAVSSANLGSPAFAAGQTVAEPLSKTYRVTRDPWTHTWRGNNRRHHGL